MGFGLSKALEFSTDTAAPGSPRPLEVSLCSAEDGPAWNDFLTRRPEASFLHRFEWGGLVSENLGHRYCFLAARRGHEICGVLPTVFFDSRIFGRFLCSMPFVDYAGPVVSDERAEPALLLEARKLAETLGASHLEVRSVAPALDWPAHTHKNLVSLDLQEGADAVWEGFKTKHRTNIRRAYKNGFTFELGHLRLLDDFYSVLSSSWRRLGSPFYSRSFFENLLNQFGASARVFVVRLEGRPVAAALNGYHGARVDGMWLGILPAARQLQPTYALYWEMIKDACERGCGTYSLGRSTSDSSAEAFKRKWNAQSKKLYWSFALLNGTKLPEPNSHKTQYRLAVEIWKRLPAGWTDRIGPVLARHFP